MNEISAKEWELLGLFEQEPERQGLDPVWLFDDSVYKMAQAGINFTCAIHPYHRDVRLMLWAGEVNIYEYSAMGVKDIAVTGEALQITINDEEVITITLKPTLNIKHETSDKT